MEHIMYFQFKLNDKRQVFIRGKDMQYSKGIKAETEMNQHKAKFENFFQRGQDDYIESYNAQVIDKLQKDSKYEQMQFIKIKEKKSQDIKTQMLRDYLDVSKGKQYREIDMKRIELEKTVKHMPVS